MTNLKVQTPSEKVIEKAQSQIKDHVIDGQGRVIKMRVPDALEEFDLNAALGEHSGNLGVAGMAQALIYIHSIDGEPLIPPKSYEQVRACIKRVGREGFKAVTIAIREYVQGEMQDGETDEIKK